MRQVISWKLLNNEQEILSKDNVECEFLPEISLEFNNEHGTHLINLKAKIYTKTNDEYKMTIDYNNKLCKILLKTKEEVSCPIIIEWLNDESKIIISYNLDDDKKTLIINMK